MRDNEIIKALELEASQISRNCIHARYEEACGFWCSQKRKMAENCNECKEHSLGYYGVIANQALDLINRQKAEIERLQKHIKEGIVLARQLPELASAIRAEAIKEFAERLKALPECQDVPAVLAVIDDLVKEMVGDSDEN